MTRRTKTEQLKLVASGEQDWRQVEQSEDKKNSLL